MMTRYRLASRLMAGLLMAAPVATQAAAQAGPVAAPGAVAAAKPGTPRAAAVERRITDLRTRLKITPEEQKPFDDFAQVMRDNEQRMDGLVTKRQASFATGSAVDQMQSYTDMAQAHAEDMQHLTAAFATLYNALSADQKKQADLSFRQFAKSRRSAQG